jgi:hypothetical protein
MVCWVFDILFSWGTGLGILGASYRVSLISYDDIPGAGYCVPLDKSDGNPGASYRVPLNTYI